MKGESSDHFYYMCHLCVNTVNGRGVRTEQNGCQAAGEWRRDSFHGYGVNTLPDGRRREGLWAKGKAVWSESMLVPGEAL